MNCFGCRDSSGALSPHAKDFENVLLVLNPLHQSNFRMRKAAAWKRQIWVLDADDHDDHHEDEDGGEQDVSLHGF